MSHCLPGTYRIMNAIKLIETTKKTVKTVNLTKNLQFLHVHRFVTRLNTLEIRKNAVLTNFLRVLTRFLNVLSAWVVRSISKETNHL